MELYVDLITVIQHTARGWECKAYWIPLDAIAERLLTPENIVEFMPRTAEASSEVQKMLFIIPEERVQKKVRKRENDNEALTTNSAQRRNTFEVGEGHT